MSSFSEIIYEVRGTAAWILHNRPAQRNAQTQLLLEEISSALDLAAADDAVRTVVIGGAGDHFSAGHDLKSAENNGKGYSVEERQAFEQRYYYDISLKIRDFPKPTIASVQGACIAGAFMVANMCDLIVASEDAFFADPVVNLFGAAAVEVLVHPSVLGLRLAKDFLFTGRRIGAREGLQVGMVSRVVAREGLSEATQELADQIAKAPPFALKLVKRSLHRTADIGGFRAGLEAHFDTHQLSHVSEEFVERGKAALARGRVAPDRRDVS